MPHSDFLKKIGEEKKETIQTLYNTFGLDFFIHKTPKLHNTFHKALARPGLHLIAELKKASPSKGLINPLFEPESLAKTYASLGASALSVLTEEHYFQGSIHTIPIAKKATTLPLLRKDFITDPIELYEAASYGADAALLIVALLSKSQCQTLLNHAAEIGLDILLEIHTEAEMETALGLENVHIIGINNRNLHTLEVDINAALAIKKTFEIDMMEKNILCVAESGYSKESELKILESNGFNAVLIGEGIVTNPSLLSFWAHD